jgi:prolyl-tRNA synthetase
MQRWSKLFIPTLREAPADAEVPSHKFLVRGGYIRQLGAGIYSYLFLAQRSINKIIAIVREEMDAIGQEFYLPALLPKEPWEASGRWTGMGDNMFRIKDRKGADLCLGMTHEEIMTTIAKNELRSYKQLPQIWYQIQSKFRDEPRPKSGLLRVRQFTMKDSYSFDIDKAGLDKSFALHDAVYHRIFARCGLKFVAVEADSGAMGGSQSQEFMVYTDAGEDLIASCPVCGYAANTEKAVSRLDPLVELEATGDGKPELIHTPGLGAIADISAYLKMQPANDIKCVAYMAQWHGKAGMIEISCTKPLIAFVRGDHMVNETKLLASVGAQEIRTMNEGEVKEVFNAPPGFLGPIGLANVEDRKTFSVARKNVGQLRDTGQRPIVVMDSALEDRKNMVCGANKLDYHFRNATPGRDFEPTIIADIRTVNEGDGCPKTHDGAACPGKLVVGKAVEIAHIFKLGYKYTESMGARVLDVNGKEVTPIMGSYGIGIERLLTAAIEQSNDRNGFWLPASIAPFAVVVSITDMRDPLLVETGEKLAAEFDAAHIDVLLDDRKERAGVKFKDADLIGIPYRVNVGKKAAEGKVELVTRATGVSVDVALADLLALVKERIAEDALLTSVDE